MPLVTSLSAAQNGRVRLQLEDGTVFLLYKGEARRLSIREGSILPEDVYDSLIRDILGKRAKKRALYLLERQERTESQLFDKLRQSGYPEVCVREAVEYVKSYHYIDDLRYAKTYIRYHQEKKSRQRLQMDLMAKGVGRDLIEQAMEEEFASDEQQKIHMLLQKRGYDAAETDEKERRRTYQFLLRRGFRSSDILHVMQTAAEE